MPTKSWTIFGAGNLINDIIDAIESNDQRVRLIVLNMNLPQEILDRIPSYISIISIDKFEPSTDYYILGFINPNKEQLLNNLKKYNLNFSNLIHKFSHVSKSVLMGQGNFVGAGAVIAPNVRIGNFNYINRLASIGHDTEVKDYNHFGPGCVVCGRCRIGNKNFLGAASSIIDGIQVADEITIGAGNVVINNIVEKGTYAGVPVKRLNKKI